MRADPSTISRRRDVPRGAISLWQLLHRYGSERKPAPPPPELAREFGVSLRTIQRWMYILRNHVEDK